MVQLSLKPARLRQRNRARVLLEIYTGHAVTRTQIAEVLGLSVMAVTRIVRELVAAGLVEEGPKSTLNPLGRPSTKLALSEAGGYVVGLSLSAYEPCVCLVNIRGELVLRRQLELDSLRKPQHAVSASGRVIQKLIADAGIPPWRVLGLGTVVGGVVDNRKGVVLTAPYLGWDSADIASPLQQMLGLPVIVENLSNALLVAEVRFGIAAGKRSVLLFRSAVGLGGSLWIDGRLVRGPHFRAGWEIGHMRIKGKTRVCSCGRMGCLNTVSSGSAVVADLGLGAGGAKSGRSAASPIPSWSHLDKTRKLLGQVCRAAAGGDTRTNEVLFRAGRYLGEASLGLLTAVDAEQVILAGPLSICASYQTGFKSGLSQGVTVASDLVAISTMDHGYAAALLALSELVLSDHLAFDRLQEKSDTKLRKAYEEISEVEL
jgi:predicted NBD/HSP70 family sugar kinase